MKSRQNYGFWFMEEIQRPEHRSRINEAFKIKEYLLRKHPILRRPNETFKEGTFTTAKIVFNTIKSIVDAHTSYVIGNPVSLTGNPDIVTDFTRIYKRGRYPRVDYELTADLIKYGNAFEYVYLDGDTIKSKVIANEDAFPVYDDCYNYTHFIEHWKDFDAGGIEHYIVYYAYMLDTQTEQTVFICCDVEVPRMGESNDMFKYSALHVYILVHGSLMQTPNGTRLDLLADKVDRLLSRNRDFGIGGGLSLVSLKRFMPNEEYYGVELYYEGCDFHNANCTPRNVK